MRSGLVGELMRAGSRIAIVAVVGGLGAACSADAMRFSENPFTNPFSGAAEQAEPRMTGSIDGAGRAPARAGAVRPAAPSPVRAAAPTAPPERYASTGTAGWTAEGGTSITVSSGDSLGAISNRYGVPAAAILSANSLTATQVVPGRRVVIPVYSASGARTTRAVPAAPAPSVAAVNPAAGRVVATAKVAVANPPAKTLAQAAAPRIRPGQPVAPVKIVARPPETRKVAYVEPKTVGSIEPKAHPRPGRTTASKPEPVGRTVAEAKPVAKPEPKAATGKVVRSEPLPAKPAKPEVVKTAKAEPKPEIVKTAKAEPKPTKAPEPAKMAEAAKPAAKPVGKAAPAEPAKVAAAAAPAAPKEVESTASVQPAAAPAAEFRWPARGRVISGFGGGGSNEGVNIAVPEGTPVKAAESGTVAYAGEEVKGYGKLVLIRHDNGYVSAYAHNGDLDVKRGQKVTRGQTIAKSGQTGNVTSPQLHFEIRKGSTPVDPMRHLASN